MTAVTRIRAEIARRDAEIEGTEVKQRLVILSAERRGLMLALDFIEAEHRRYATVVREVSPAIPQRYMSQSVELCAALRARMSA